VGEVMARRLSLAVIRGIPLALLLYGATLAVGILHGGADWEKPSACYDQQGGASAVYVCWTER